MSEVTKPRSLYEKLVKLEHETEERLANQKRELEKTVNENSDKDNQRYTQLKDEVLGLLIKLREENLVKINQTSEDFQIKLAKQSTEIETLRSEFVIAKNKFEEFHREMGKEVHNELEKITKTFERTIQDLVKKFSADIEAAKNGCSLEIKQNAESTEVAIREKTSENTKRYQEIMEKINQLIQNGGETDAKVKEYFESKIQSQSKDIETLKIEFSLGKDKFDEFRNTTILKDVENMSKVDQTKSYLKSVIQDLSKKHLIDIEMVKDSLKKSSNETAETFEKLEVQWNTRMIRLRYDLLSRIADLHP